MAQTNDIWIFIETGSDGEPASVGLELLNPGRRLAQKQGGKLVAVVIAKNALPGAKAAAGFGADTVITIEGEEYHKYSTEAYTDAMEYLIKKYAPGTVVIGATNNGRDLGPRVSARLQTGLTADCTQLDIDDAKNCIAWTRPTFGGNLMAVILCPEHKPQMGTARPGVFKKLDYVEREPQIIKENFVVDPQKIRTRIVKVISEVGERVNLEEADIIISGGRGVRGAEGFDLIRAFAKKLGATVGASRGAVEESWIPHAHQVGQTGKHVMPRVYIACGISGASQHVAGMIDSGIVIALNKDPNALIFGIADYGIVGDLFETLPVLSAELSAILG